MSTSTRSTQCAHAYEWRRKIELWARVFRCGPPSEEKWRTRACQWDGVLMTKTPPTSYIMMAYNASVSLHSFSCSSSNSIHALVRGDSQSSVFFNFLAKMRLSLSPFDRLLFIPSKTSTCNAFRRILFVCITFVFVIQQLSTGNWNSFLQLSILRKFCRFYFL